MPLLVLQDRTNTVALASGSGLAAATADLDVRAGGNAAFSVLATFELLCRWATNTGILAGVAIADLFLVPLIDGSNLPDVDLTATTSAIPVSTYVGTFPCARQPASAADMRFVLENVPLMVMLYRAHIINRSGQTVTTTSGTSWQLRVFTQ
jgi:hypothetical protein